MEKQNRKELMSKYKARKVIGGIVAIKNTVNGKMLIVSTGDLQGRKNRFDFSKKMGNYDDLKLKDDFNKFGIDAFVFEVLEELKKTDTQTDAEFMADLKVLHEMWLEKYDSSMLY